MAGASFPLRGPVARGSALGRQRWSRAVAMAAGERGMKRIHLALAGILSFVAGAAAPTAAREDCPPCDDDVPPLEEGTYDVVDGSLSNGTVEVRADGGVRSRY